MTTDPRFRAFERVIRDAALQLLDRFGTVDDVRCALAALSDSAPVNTPRQVAAATHQRRREMMIADFERLEREGRGRQTASLVARKYAKDKNDRVEVKSLARKLQRWRRERKSDSVALGQMNGATSDRKVKP